MRGGLGSYCDRNIQLGTSFSVNKQQIVNYEIAQTLLQEFESCAYNLWYF